MLCCLTDNLCVQCKCIARLELQSIATKCGIVLKNPIITSVMYNVGVRLHAVRCLTDHLFSQCRCIVGREPRSFDATRGTMLINLAEMAVRQLERNWALSEATQSRVQLMRSLACYEEAFLFLDTSQPGNWRVLHINRAAASMLGKRCMLQGRVLHNSHKQQKVSKASHVRLLRSCSRYEEMCLLLDTS